METKIHYYAAWTECGFLLNCYHQHKTVPEAVDCEAEISHAESYVVAVENGVQRALNDEEEAEFQRTPRKRPKLAVLHYDASGYAVMVRFRLPDSWTWTTWMRFETYEQAVAHARANEKVVPFGSAEWHALCQSRERALPASPILTPRLQVPRGEGETLVEYVSRLIPAPLDPSANESNVKDLERAFPAASEPLRPTFTDLVLQWINFWELKALGRIYSLLLSAAALVSSLRSKVRRGRSRD